MNVIVDDRWKGDSGIGRMYREILKRRPNHIHIRKVNPNISLGNPLSPVSLGLEIAKNKGDLFWSPSFMPPVYSKIPLIVTIHDLMHMFYYGKFHELYYKTVLRYLVSNVAMIITVSKVSKELIIDKLKINPDKINVIYNGVGAEFYQTQKISLEKPYLLYVGNRREYKNIPNMLKGFANSKYKGDLFFLISGNPDASLSKLIELLKIKGNVIFTGFIKDEDLPKYYAGALATMFVSKMEGFGLPILESMASRTPVITSNRSSLAEIAGDAAFKVNPDDPLEIAAGIDMLVQDSELVSSLVEDGYKRSNEFNWELTAKETWEAIYTVGEKY